MGRAVRTGIGTLIERTACHLELLRLSDGHAPVARDPRTELSTSALA